MSEELNLVAELAVILIAAGVFTVISRALKQPLILGYIIAGFIVSPHLGLIKVISSTESVSQWSEIGIIFLLFALGLEFSFKKLLKVGSSALITAVTICIGMFTVGMVAGNAFGWTMMESLFLGGLLSMSSTTVIIKAYDDMGLKKKPYAPLVFGTLVVEDLIAVLLMVLLSTLAVSQQFSGGKMLWSLARLAFFLILWFLVGLYVIPIILKKAEKYLNDEILLIISIGLCFGMVSLATAAGFSAALGAFVMGSILAETVEGERIEHLLSGIKNLFGAIFFVSVGMMIDPAVIGQHWFIVLILAVIAMGGLLLFSTTGSLLAGQGLDNSVHVGFTMAQLGEFSFIIASLGCSLGVMRGFIYPVIIAVSVITTFAAPYMIKAGDPASRWLAAKLPPNILARINPQPGDSGSASKAESNEWSGLVKSYALRVVLYSVILIAVLLASRLLLPSLAEKLLPFLSEPLRKLICLLLTLGVMIPFLYGLAITNGSIGKHASKLLKERASNRWPILSLMVIRILIAIGFILAAITSYFKLGGWGVLAVIGAGLLLIIVGKASFRNLSGLERRFMENFNAREEMERRKAPVTSSLRDNLSGYDIKTSAVVVPQDFAYIGKTLREMPFRKKSGVNIVKIKRGSKSIQIPSGDEPIYPGDILLAVGTSEQLHSFEQIIKENTLATKEDAPEFAVKLATLLPESFLTGKKIRETDMRGSGCMIISIKHDGKIIANPGADYVFCEGDTIWIAGEEKSCDWFLGTN
ncbi:MAG: cation:proton antiporter [Bacteroidales bacterium]|nr:cation:proton antiporter [Bacteroidales bacterium]